MTNRSGMPKQKPIKEHWAKWLVEHGKFDSVDELMEANYCFACGFDYGKNVLDRAHITALVDGGSNEVSNLHLLCSLCHKASELLAGEDYFAWFGQRNVFHRMLEAACRNQTGGATKLPGLMSLLDDFETSLGLLEMSISFNQGASQNTKKANAARRAQNGSTSGPKSMIDPAARELIHRRRVEGASLRTIAAELNAAGYVTGRGNATWSHGNVAAALRSYRFVDGTWTNDDPAPRRRGVRAQVSDVADEYEQSMIANRTKQALAEARARGVTLGRPVELDRAIVAQILARRATGMTFQAIADNLNLNGFLTPRGKPWSEANIRQAIMRNGGDPRPAPRGRRPQKPLGDNLLDIIS